MPYIRNIKEQNTISKCDIENPHMEEYCKNQDFQNVILRIPILERLV
jgi:hypothetical protein